MINRVSSAIAKHSSKHATPGRRYVIVLDKDDPIIIQTRGVDPNDKRNQPNDFPTEENNNE
jgi:hypothetical protein